MTHDAHETRKFIVQARHLDRHHAQLVEEASCEAAAVAYVEDLHVLTDEDAISVIVRDVLDGHEHCFWVDLESGETSTCA